MTVRNLAGKPLKHWAQDKKTNERYVMISYENETDKNTCSVVNIDDLDTNIRAELTSFINSDECQRVAEVWKVLDRKFFMDYPKQTALHILRAMRKIKVVDSENVAVMMYNGGTNTPIEVMKGIREYNAKKQQQTKGFSPIEESAPTLVSEPQPVPVSEPVPDKMDEINKKLDALTGAIASLVTALTPKETEKKKK